MKACIRYVLAGLPALLLAVLISFAPQTASAQDGPAFSQQELDQMLAPIALYPDSLLSQIMMAATYPLEVVEAARWSRANPSLNGDQAVRAADPFNWDPSVKSLLAFPQILYTMDENLAWMQRLGDAFLDQQPQVMDTVQNLRQRAYAAGNLRSTDQIRVEQQGPVFAVEEANPQDVYVPYYDPTVVYGPWRWPAYPPFFWAPWPGYYASPGYAFAWGIGIRVGAGFFFGAFDWSHRHVNAGGTRTGPPGAWHHDPDHRRGVPYRDASVRQRFGRASVSPETRRDYRGRAPAAPEQRGAPSHAGPPAGSSPPAVGTRPIAEPRPHAFEGVGQGARVRTFSERGRASSQSPAPRPAPAARPPGNAPASRAPGTAPASRAPGNAPRSGGTGHR